MAYTWRDHVPQGCQGIVVRANRNPLQVVEAATAVVKEQTKSRVDYPRSECGKKLHSFNFTTEEETAIAKACEGALEYFESYGKGYEPDRVLMVNKKRYDN